MYKNNHFHSPNDEPLKLSFIIPRTGAIHNYDINIYSKIYALMYICVYDQHMMRIIIVIFLLIFVSTFLSSIIIQNN